MKRYKNIIFDLFGTVVHFDESRLPVFKYQDDDVHCTTLPLYNLASQVQNGYSIDFFHQTLNDIIVRFRREKSKLLREISCLTRMEALLNQLNFPDDQETATLAFRMKEIHMSWMRHCVYLPAGYQSFLGKLSALRIGLLSNFDDTSTGYQILHELNISSHFHTVLFSDEAGMIKPHSELFNQIMTKMNAKPSEILFVGDTPEADILGPKKIGMDTAWINPGKYAFPEAAFRPDYEIKNITELESIIQI